MSLFPLLKDASMLFHSLCDLISYELFFGKNTGCILYASIGEFVSAMRDYKKFKDEFL